MNPLAENVDYGNLPPMLEVRKTLKINWYRCPIERDILRQLSRPDDSKGFFQAIGHLGLWCLSATLTFVFYTSGWWLAFIVSLFSAWNDWIISYCTTSRALPSDSL